MTPQNASSPLAAGSSAAVEDRPREGSGAAGREPFAQVPEWLLYTKISDRAVRLYALLARHRNDRTGRCDPGRERLAALLNCSTGSVDRAIKELVQIGAVTKKSGHGADHGTNSYTLHPDPPSHVATGDELASSHVATRDELGSAQVLTGEKPKSSRVRTKRDEENEKTDVAVRAHAQATAPAECAAEPEAFAEAVAPLSPKGPQRERWLVAFVENESGFLAIVREVRRSPGVRSPEALIDSRVMAGEHRDVSAAATVELPPIVRAEQFVTRSGWQFEEDDLADRLKHDYGLEQAEREPLLGQARDLRATRLKEAA